MLHTNCRLILLIVMMLFVSAGCTTLEVGIETSPQPTQIITAEPPTEVETDTPTPLVMATETAAVEETPQITEIPSQFPKLVSIGHLAPYGSGDFGVLVLKDGALSVQPSPVPFQIFWEYTAGTGRLAYSPEFVHPSDNNNIPVTSLWVYDYESDTAEMWLADNVIRAAWSPDGGQVTAAVYNPGTEQIDLVSVSGPDQVELIAECASHLFSWSPEGDQLAYVNVVSWAGVNSSCAGTYIVSFPGGLTGGEPLIERVSDFGSWELLSGHPTDQPIWAAEQNALIYPDQPFWIVPLDGSQAFVPATPQGEDPLNIPRLFGSLWSAELRQLVGNYDSGLSGQGGVWIYQLSEDLRSIQEYYRIGEFPQGQNTDITLVSWWNPGESILVLDGENYAESEFLNELWRAPAVWSLADLSWDQYPR